MEIDFFGLATIKSKSSRKKITVLDQDEPLTLENTLTISFNVTGEVSGLMMVVFNNKTLIEFDESVLLEMANTIASKECPKNAIISAPNLVNFGKNTLQKRFAEVILQSTEPEKVFNLEFKNGDIESIYYYFANTEKIGSA